MSFSFNAGGSLEETRESLNSDSLAHMSSDGERTRQLVLSFLDDVPDVGGDGTPLRFDVSAYGHHNAGGSMPLLSIALTCKYVQPSETADASDAATATQDDDGQTYSGDLPF